MFSLADRARRRGEVSWERRFRRRLALHGMAREHRAVRLGDHRNWRYHGQSEQVSLKRFRQSNEWHQKPVDPTAIVDVHQDGFVHQSTLLFTICGGTRDSGPFPNLSSDYGRNAHHRYKVIAARCLIKIK
jgi:hypothetical protein